MGCSYSVRKSEPLEVEYDGGIIRGHAYSVLDVREFKHLRFLKIRNPWGKKEWTGPWADFGPEWERLRENYPDAPDWMVNYRCNKNKPIKKFIPSTPRIKWSTVGAIAPIKKQIIRHLEKTNYPTPGEKNLFKKLIGQL